jgi:uncharacterized protein (TIGR02186 family)
MNKRRVLRDFGRYPLAAMLFWLAFGAPAKAEDLVIALSTREVAITSTYSGADITFFGAIERDARTVARAGGYDIVAQVQGPGGTIVLQQKHPFGPLWLATEREKFAKMPLFFATLASRPLKEIVSEDMRERLKLGLEYFLETPQRRQDFVAAMLRLRAAETALVQDDKAITMLRPNLFTGKLSLPARAPTGLYVLHITVLAEGIPLKTVQAGFVVRKVGFDALVADAARNAPFSYGLLTILISILLGWMANLMFRRD